MIVFVKRSLKNFLFVAVCVHLLSAMIALSGFGSETAQNAVHLVSSAIGVMVSLNILLRYFLRSQSTLHTPKYWIDHASPAMREELIEAYIELVSDDAERKKFAVHMDAVRRLASAREQGVSFTAAEYRKIGDVSGLGQETIRKIRNGQYEPVNKYMLQIDMCNFRLSTVINLFRFAVSEFFGSKFAASNG